MIIDYTPKYDSTASVYLPIMENEVNLGNYIQGHSWVDIVFNVYDLDFCVSKVPYSNLFTVRYLNTNKHPLEYSVDESNGFEIPIKLLLEDVTIDVHLIGTLPAYLLSSLSLYGNKLSSAIQNNLNTTANYNDAIRLHK